MKNIWRKIDHTLAKTFFGIKHPEGVFYYHQIHRGTEEDWQEYRNQARKSFHRERGRVDHHLFPLLKRIHNHLALKSAFYHHWHLWDKSHHIHHGAFVWHVSVTLFVLFANFYATFGLFAWDLSENNIISQTNRQRVAYGLSGLKIDDRLSFSAALKAEDMVRKKYFAHYGPDGLGPAHFFKKAHVDFKEGGENLAKGYEFTEELVQAWMDSPTHRDNILHREFKKIGIAVAEFKKKSDGHIVYIVVQHLSDPRLPDSLVLREESDSLGEQIPGKFIITSIEGNEVSASEKDRSGWTTYARRTAANIAYYTEETLFGVLDVLGIRI